jgi:pyridoxamine 5'-phosphate oxidase family protein
MFTTKEIAYLKGRKLACIATVSADSQPDVAPVNYDFDGESFYVSGLSLSRTLKYRNIQHNPKVSLAVDDLEDGDSWKPRGVKIHGTADLVTRDGYLGQNIYIRVKPDRKWSWGVDEPAIQNGKPVINRARGSQHNA